MALRQSRRLSIWFVLLACPLWMAAPLQAAPCGLSLLAFCPSNTGVLEITGIAHVTDGDTFDIGPASIRLHGLDAPETGQSCETSSGKTWPCGGQAKARLAELIDGKTVTCFARERDPYGRLIALCAQGGREINPIMVREGLAWAFTKFSADYVSLESQARAAKAGVWQGQAEAPWDYRADRWARAAEASPRKGCPIKGNISPEGEKIYHTPWSPLYDRTKIDAAAGERWFCAEAEALAAGWRASRSH
jgi:endonuclease YncB( thermonuclease family)